MVIIKFIFLFLVIEQGNRLSAVEKKVTPLETKYTEQNNRLTNLENDDTGVYIRWGKRSCNVSTATTIYEGIAAGSLVRLQMFQNVVMDFEFLV